MEKKTAIPQAKIKTIMKLDKQVHNISLDGVYAVTIATHLFLEILTMEAHQFTQQSNRKTLNYQDVASAINDIHEFEFLTEIVPNQVAYMEAMEKRKALLEQNEQ
ncbi:Chromatin accessibility complex protein 1 [Boothiomyces sp. JEL0866]|nr:Chromatin accessibility complex protein 1 [Boothiomyces sp. JEL0866]